MLIRNDDVCVDLDADFFKQFCELCDKYKVKLIHGVTPLGECLDIDSKMNNDEIVALGKHKTLAHNTKLLEYLKTRNDGIAVHGLWHTHFPSEEDTEASKTLLKGWGLTPEYLIWPFNEETDRESFCGLEVVPKCQRLEDYLYNFDIPTDDTVYLHSWRFMPGKWYKLQDLEVCLHRITNTQT